jgi:hypothetical protein
VKVTVLVVHVDGIPEIDVVGGAASVVGVCEGATVVEVTGGESTGAWTDTAVEVGL